MTYEKECVNTGEEAISRVVHFIKVDTRFGFLDWLAVMAVRKSVKPDKIMLFRTGKFNSCWWNRTKPLVSDKILLKHIWVTKQNNITLKKSAHKADFLRTALFYHLGGIYMDNDVLPVKSFDSLLYNQVVLSHEMKGRVGNALILARKNSCFMCAFARYACQRYN